jgi:hypothetical protein
MAEIILSRIRRPNTIQTLFRNRISWFEQLSTFEAQWFTTKSDGMCQILSDIPTQLNIESTPIVLRNVKEVIQLNIGPTPNAQSNVVEVTQQGGKR